MARIAGVNIPTNKRVVIALTYIHGIGSTKAKEIVAKLGIADTARVQDLTNQEVLHIEKAAGVRSAGDHVDHRHREYVLLLLLFHHQN